VSSSDSSKTFSSAFLALLSSSSRLSLLSRTVTLLFSPSIALLRF
jgi:hypothetical protein